MLECFVTTLSKWMSYKNRLVFAYYYILGFYCFKESLQNILKTWQVLRWKKKFFWKISKYRNTVFYDFKSRFLVIFLSNYWHRLVLEIPFPDHIFPKISNYRSENLKFPSTGKYYAPRPTSSFLSSLERKGLNAVLRKTFVSNLFEV